MAETLMPETVVTVELGARSYDIAIGPGVLADAGRRLTGLTGLTGNRRIAVVTDSNVAPLHLDRLRRGLGGFSVAPLVVPAGEGSKDFATLERVVNWLLELQVKRSDVVLALGGGVVGDLAGFAAAIVKRGMDFIQIPTTLLAMVDSSVGGKTGIDTAAGKNLVGAFHQPRAVWADLDCLQTLPRRQMQAGYAEIVKYGLIRDLAFYEWCEANAARLLAGDRAALAQAVAASCRAKAAVVAADELETHDLRALLNFGHTFGHALEAEVGFSDALLHGEAVAIGMVQALQFSAARGLCDAAAAPRLARHLAGLGMRTTVAGLGLGPADAGRLVQHMRQDKKATDAGLSFILAKAIGDAHVVKGIQPAAVEQFLAQAMAPATAAAGATT